ncbi:hypothetical protein Tco_0818058, partial [Tanacetum coccineum]
MIKTKAPLSYLWKLEGERNDPVYPIDYDLEDEVESPVSNEDELKEQQRKQEEDKQQYEELEAEDEERLLARKLARMN